MGNAQVAKGRKKIKRIGKKVGNVVVIMRSEERRVGKECL